MLRIWDISPKSHVDIHLSVRVRTNTIPTPDVWLGRNLRDLSHKFAESLLPCSPMRFLLVVVEFCLFLNRLSLSSSDYLETQETRLVLDHLVIHLLQPHVLRLSV